MDRVDGVDGNDANAQGDAGRRDAGASSSAPEPRATTGPVRSERVGVVSLPRALSRIYAPNGKPRAEYLTGKERQELTDRCNRIAQEKGMDPLDVELFLRYNVAEGGIPGDLGLRETVLKGLWAMERVQPPVWQEVTGFYNGYEDAPRRRERVRALWKTTVLLIRRELKWNEEEIAAGKNVGERSVFWDPAAEVCRWQEISRTKLSAYCRELTGSNLVQTIDNVKAETLRAKLRKEIREFVLKHKVQIKQRLEELGKKETWSKAEEKEVDALGAINVTENGEVTGLDKWAVWKALKASRKYPEFSWDSWARELGFASYRRLYRACVCKWDLTPHQMILELIEEALGSGDGESAGGPPAPQEFKAWTLEEIEGGLRAVRPFSMLT